MLYTAIKVKPRRGYPSVRYKVSTSMVITRRLRSSCTSGQPALGAAATTAAAATSPAGRGVRKARPPPPSKVDKKGTEKEEEIGAAEVAEAGTARFAPSQSPRPSSYSSVSLLLTLTITLFALFVRHAVSLHSYSGMHTPPLYGDYEAQRHWMEVTLHVPLRDWYRNTPMNDLEHWGLDYPPLTAYVSYVCGIFCDYFEPASMALHSSWGYETTTHKALMRLTVLVLDLLLFFPAILLLASSLPSLPPALPPSSPPALALLPPRLAFLLLLLLQPSLMLIDHGHFQYNSVCLGLALLGATFILRGYELVGSVLFSLAINFKHIALYYAMAFFAFLLHRSLSSPLPFLRVLVLGLTVTSTFAVLWLPFCLDSEEGCVAGLRHVLHRLFPLKRGLFEDKVANFWYVLSIPLDLRSLLPVEHLALISLGTTLLALAPSVAFCLHAPSSFASSFPPSTSSSKGNGKKTKGRAGRTTSSSPPPSSFLEGERFLLALFNSSIAFFMFSFQVHEKSLLFPLLPAACALYAFGDPFLGWWLGVLGAFSMYPLLERDGLTSPYWATLLLHSVTNYLLVSSLPSSAPSSLPPSSSSSSSTSTSVRERVEEFCRASPHALWKQIFVGATTLIMLLLHLAAASMTPPSRYPHLWSLLFSVFSAACLGVLLLYMNVRQWLVR